MKPLIRVSEYLKYLGFWALDFVSGSKVRSHLKDIKSILESKDSPQADAIRKDYLENVLQHAVTTTTFYKGFNPNNGLAAFPVINKNTINKNPTHFQSSVFAHTKIKKVTTSGSTGALLSITQNRNKNYRNVADTLYFSNLAGYQVGYKLFYLRHWSNYFKKNKWLLFLQNMYPVEVVGLSDHKIATLIDYIKQDASKKSWLGYASGFDRLCQYLDATASKPLDAGFKSIIAISEHLSEQTRQRMAYYFKTPVVSRYSNMENGIIAQQPTDGSTHFIINWASYHVEILDLEQDIPVAPGAIGRIVITDLFNYATPLIRYDTGDLGAIDHSVSPPVFTNIEGRRYDAIFNTDGQMVSPLLISSMVNYQGVLQAQLIQEHKKHYVLKLNVTDAFKQEAQLINDFKAFLGEDAEIALRYVNDIPLLNSGKRKIAINTYTQQT
ncbi:CoF synthetase [Mariniflexile aquimaris]|uniref:CoF synthetase n=1 Tax=Mariniflexile aquimaris TaxID=881009 RepID=A0ABW3BV13_9FLAO